MKKQRGEAAIIVAVLVAVFGVILLFWGLPMWNVWRKGLSGEAQLREAEWNRQIIIEEAKAKSESAKLLAGVEVERAKGVAEANRIIGDSLKGNDAYLRYLWIQGMQTNQMQVVYVPTEANLPILEANRLQQKPDASLGAAQ
jgi:hypothetical protein